MNDKILDALEACFGVMMQFCLSQPKEGDDKLYFSVPYDANVIIEARARAEKMYYEAIKPKEQVADRTV